MRNTRRVIYMVAGAALAAGLLYLLFRNADLALLGEELRQARLPWLAAAGACFVSAAVTRGVRWWPALCARTNVRLRAAYGATQISQFANMALPVRGGPIFRALAISRLSGAPFSYAFGASFADRAAEGVVLATMLCALAVGISLEGVVPISTAAEAAVGTMLGIAAFILIVTAAMIIAAMTRDVGASWLARRVSERIATRAHASWGEFAAAVRGTLFSSRGIFVWLGAVFAWACMIAGHACVLSAFAVDWAWAAPVLTCVFSTATVVLPGTPGHAGPFHAAVVAGLGIAMPTLANETQLAIALTAHALQTGTLAVLGTIALLTEHESLWRLEAAESALEAGKDCLP